MLLDNLPTALSLGHLNAIIEAFSDLLFILDSSGSILDYRAGDSSLLFTSPKDFLGRRMQDVLPADVSHKFAAAIRQAQETESAIVLGYSLEVAKHEHWFEARVVPVPHHQLVVVIRDITRYKQAQEKIQSQVNRLNALRAIDTLISSGTDLTLTLSQLLSHVTAQLNVDAAGILLFNDQSNLLEYKAGIGFHTDALQGTRLRLGEGYAGIAALQRKTICIADLQHRRTDFLRSPNFQQEAFKLYFGVPLIAKGRILGVLEIFHRTLLNPERDWLDFMEALAGQAAIAIENAALFSEIQRSNTELMSAYDATIKGWSHALDLRDHDTEEHTQRVTEMTLQLASRLGFDAADLVQIRRGAILHDIGKMAVPDHILLKPGPLTEEEWAVIRQHPQYAYEFLSTIAFLESALDIPHFHHEKWDGSGYPYGLKGDQIPLSARLFAVVDVFDALTSDRSYRLAWTRQDATTYIRDQAGKHFDPRVAHEFLAMIERQE